MGTLAEKLVYLNNTKLAIKTAIEAKDVDCTGATFRALADKIGEITGGGVVAKNVSLGSTDVQASTTGWRAVTFDTALNIDSTNFSVDENGEITLLAGGWFIFTAIVTLTAGTSGVHAIAISENIDSVYTDKIYGDQISATITSIRISGIRQFASGQKFALRYYSSATTQVITDDGSGISLNFAITKV